MATYTLTPARRAALRKAQLASAAKRRRHGTVPQTLRRSIGQRTGYAKASFQVKSRDFQKSSRTRKGLKYAAVGLGTAALAAGAYKHAELGAAQRRVQKDSQGTYEPRKQDILRTRRHYRAAERAHSKAVKAGIKETKASQRYVSARRRQYGYSK